MSRMVPVHPTMWRQLHEERDALKARVTELEEELVELKLLRSDDAPRPSVSVEQCRVLPACGLPNGHPGGTCRIRKPNDCNSPGCPNERRAWELFCKEHCPSEAAPETPCVKCGATWPHVGAICEERLARGVGERTAGRCEKHAGILWGRQTWTGLDWSRCIHCENEQRDVPRTNEAPLRFGSRVTYLDSEAVILDVRDDHGFPVYTIALEDGRIVDVGDASLVTTPTGSVGDAG